MKYALLIYNAQDARDLPEDQLEALIDEYEELFQLPGVIDGQQLQLPGRRRRCASRTAMRS